MLGTGRHKKRYLVLGVGFTGGLATAGAQNLAAYTVYAGKIKKIHKVSQVTYTSLVPLSQAIYFPAQDLVALVPKGKHKLPKLEQLHVNVNIVTDPEGRPINNGQPLTATVTNTGLVDSSDLQAAAVDAYFEREDHRRIR